MGRPEREGPIIQIGAAIGSGFGQWLRLNLNDMRVLIGCGSAAGIASIFNAPLAGVLFAMEVLLRDVSLRSFVPIIMAAILSSTVTQAIRGHNDPIFPVPAQLTGVGGVEPVYKFTVAEFGNYAALGVLCGLVAAAFVKSLYRVEDFFHGLRMHRVLRVMLGGLLVGLVGLGTEALLRQRVPHVAAEPSEGGRRFVTRELDTTGEPPLVMGNGYPVITQTLQPKAYESAGFVNWTAWALVVLLVGKLLSTVLTLGSGGSGGVFAPSLFMGAATGGAFGLFLEWLGWFPSLSPGAYALVGMGAVVAASIQAPLTATLILFELTRDYKVVIPIMLAAVIGLAVARWIEPASIYTLKLLRRGIRLASGELRILQQIAVRDVPRQKAVSVGLHDPVDKLLHLMRTTTASDFVVVDDDGRMVGMVVGADVRTVLVEREAMPLLVVSDVMRGDPQSVQLDETLDSVLEKFAGEPIQSLPVIDPDHPDKVTELLTRAAVMNRYHQSVAAQRAMA